MAEKFENETVTFLFGFVFEKARAGKSRDYRDAIVCENVFKMFPVHAETANRRFQIPPV